MANANSKIYFACGANKKAFGQIDQPKGTKPREAEIRTLGVRRKVELRLQRAERQQTKQEDQEEDQDQGDQGREEEKVWCTLSESVDSMYL